MTSDDTVQHELDGLRRAMQARASIEQAKGIMMFVYQVDDDRAFAILRRWSMHHQVKVRALAEALIDLSVCSTTARHLDSPAHEAVRDGLRRVGDRPLLLEA